jgi:hypothetical protein
VGFTSLRDVVSRPTFSGASRLPLSSLAGRRSGHP